MTNNVAEMKNLSMPINFYKQNNKNLRLVTPTLITSVLENTRLQIQNFKNKINNECEVSPSLLFRNKS
jgi:hypothetical protein